MACDMDIFHVASFFIDNILIIKYLFFHLLLRAFSPASYYAMALKN